jgi:hypothetical protein
MAGSDTFELEVYDDELGRYVRVPDPSSKSLSVRKQSPKATQKRRFEAKRAERRRANEAAMSNVGELGSGIASIPGRVVNYIKSSTPSSVGRDVKGIAKSTIDAAVENPNAFIEDAIASIPAGIRDFGDVRETARKLRAQGRKDEAEAMEAMAGTAILSALPIIGRPAGVAVRNAIKAAEKTAIKGAKKAATKAPASPKIEFERPSVSPIATQAGERGLPLRGQAQTQAQHPSKFGVFSSYKTPTPVEETIVVAEPYAVLPRDRMFDTSRLENAKIVSLYGDRERAGDTILRVNDHPTNVDTQGGAMFPALQEALESEGAWASEFGALGPVRRAVAEGLDAGQRVFGVTTAMGPGALNQTIDMTDLLHQMATTSPIRKSDLSVFNKRARDVLPGYAGLLHDEAAQQLHGMTQGQRKAFVALLDNAGALNQGFPSVPAARYALTDENLLDVPAGTSGYSFVEFGPESLKSLEGGVGHRSYPDRMAGTYEGRGPLVPFTTMFSDFAKSRRDANALAGSDLRAFELGKPSQNMTPEAYDLLMKYLEGIEDPY